MPFDPRAFRSSPRVQAMTWAERGLYLYLLLECWETGGSIPDDASALRRALRLSPSHPVPPFPAAVRACFEERDGRLWSTAVLAIRPRINGKEEEAFILKKGSSSSSPLTTEPPTDAAAESRAIAVRVLEPLGVDCGPRWGIVAKLQALADTYRRPLAEIVQAVVIWLRGESQRRQLENPGAMLLDGLDAGWLPAKLGLLGSEAQAPEPAAPQPRDPERDLSAIRVWDWSLEDAVLRMMQARAGIEEASRLQGLAAELRRDRPLSWLGTLRLMAPSLVARRGAPATLLGIVQAFRAMLAESGELARPQAPGGLAWWRQAEAQALPALEAWVASLEPAPEPAP